MEKKKSLREKYPLAFRPPSPPTSSRWQDMTDDEIMALGIPGVDPNAHPTLHADQIDIQICEKLRVSPKVWCLATSIDLAIGNR